VISVQEQFSHLYYAPFKTILKLTGTVSTLYTPQQIYSTLPPLSVEYTIIHYSLLLLLLLLFNGLLYICLLLTEKPFQIKNIIMQG
jgi:hypothetical protein